MTEFAIRYDGVVVTSQVRHHHLAVGILARWPEDVRLPKHIEIGVSPISMGLNVSAVRDGYMVEIFLGKPSLEHPDLRYGAVADHLARAMACRSGDPT